MAWYVVWAQIALNLFLGPTPKQGVSYSQTFRSKYGFISLANGRNSQFVFQVFNRVSKCKNNEIKI